MMEWITPIGFILAGLLAGIIGEKVIFKKLETFVNNKRIAGGNIIFRSLHRMTFIWFVIGGFFLGNSQRTPQARYCDRATKNSDDRIAVFSNPSFIKIGCWVC